MGLAFLGFISLCFAASAAYVENDLRDMQSDRTHWSKRQRPIARRDGADFSDCRFRLDLG
jgi:4-hydroxybenzoate polyprenyltransferase